MSQAIAIGSAARPSQKLDWLPVVPVMAWRNLGRRRYRTWLSAGSLGFAILLIGCGITLQVGSYVQMIERGTELLSGHAQLQHRQWKEDPRIEHVIENADLLGEQLRQVPGVAGLAIRVQGSGLVANSDAPDNAGKAGLVMGIDPDSERQVSVIPQRILRGRYLQSGDEAVIGDVLARNLGLDVGDELVVIGSALGGGIAAFVCELVGIFDAGHPMLNRTLVQAPRELVASAFNLEGQAHSLALSLDDPSRSDEVLAAVTSALGFDERESEVRVLDWRQVNPELYSSIRMDAVSSVFIYSIILVMVAFTILGSVLMAMFERRSEFGVLMALGMRVSTLRALMHWEVFWLWTLGLVIGLSIVGLFVGWYGNVGIPVPMEEGMEAMLESFHMDPRMYPAFSSIAFVWIPLALLVMAQLAVVFGTRQLSRRLPAEILRSV